MRTRRIKASGSVAIYHCTTRCVNGEFLLGEEEDKEFFQKLLWECAEFSGVEILTYCIMSNHFHVLVQVSQVERVSDKELMRRYELLYPKPTKYKQASINEMKVELKRGGQNSGKIREQLLKRMHNVSEFMKLVKQRYSTWYNKTHNRYGTLWADRFKSVMVEGAENPLLTMAAYIDLNPVRAGLVSDPKDYRFSGYGEAVSGGTPLAKAGMCKMMKFSTVMREADVREQRNDASYTEKETSFDEEQSFLTFYGTFLYARGSCDLTHEEYLEALERKGVLDKNEILRLRVRYFSDGMVFGSKEYVESFFNEHRSLFGKKRQDGARKMRGSDWGGLHIIRDLRKDVFG